MSNKHDGVIVNFYPARNRYERVEVLSELGGVTYPLLKEASYANQCRSNLLKLRGVDDVQSEWGAFYIQRSENVLWRDIRKSIEKALRSPLARKEYLGDVQRVVREMHPSMAGRSAACG